MILGLIHWNLNITRVLMQNYAWIKLLTRNAIGNAIAFPIAFLYFTFFTTLNFELIEKIMILKLIH